MLILDGVLVELVFLGERFGVSTQVDERCLRRAAKALRRSVAHHTILLSESPFFTAVTTGELGKKAFSKSPSPDVGRSGRIVPPYYYYSAGRGRLGADLCCASCGFHYETTEYAASIATRRGRGQGARWTAWRTTSYDAAWLYKEHIRDVVRGTTTWYSCPVLCCAVLCMASDLPT